MLAGSEEGSLVEEQSDSVETELQEIRVEQANRCLLMDLEIEVEQKVVVEQVEWNSLSTDC